MAAPSNDLLEKKRAVNFNQTIWIKSTLGSDGVWIYNIGATMESQWEINSFQEIDNPGYKLYNV